MIGHKHRRRRGDRALDSVLGRLCAHRLRSLAGLCPHSARLSGGRNHATERRTASSYDPAMAPQRTPTDITDAPRCATDEAPHGATQALSSDVARADAGASVPQSTSAPASPPSPTRYCSQKLLLLVHRSRLTSWHTPSSWVVVAAPGRFWLPGQASGRASSAGGETCRPGALEARAGVSAMRVWDPARRPAV